MPMHVRHLFLRKDRGTLIVSAVALLSLLPCPALAQSSDMPGQQLLQFARSYIIAPIALFAMVVSGVAAFMRPEMIKVTGYIAFVAVILYFLTANADRILQVLRAG